MTKVARLGTEPGSDPVSVLAITSPPDYRCLERILAHTRWSLEGATCLADAMRHLREFPGVVLITDAVLVDGNWKDLLAHTTQQEPSPPVIVAAHHADDRLWMEVLNSGGYNLLGKPFEEQDVFRVVSMAWLHGRRRVQAAAYAR